MVINPFKPQATDLFIPCVILDSRWWRWWRWWWFSHEIQKAQIQKYDFHVHYHAQKTTSGKEKGGKWLVLPLSFRGENINDKEGKVGEMNLKQRCCLVQRLFWAFNIMKIVIVCIWFMYWWSSASYAVWRIKFLRMNKGEFVWGREIEREGVVWNYER